jgi:imidazolonepropionase
MSTLYIKNIGMLQTPIGSHKHSGKAQGENLKLHGAAILIEDGIIREIYSGSETQQIDVELELDPDTVIDAEGRLVTPGLVDGHTHLVFGGYRQHEIPLKLRGASYLEILQAGGGILDTVRETRKASHRELVDKSQLFLDEMLAMGVTTCEVKSGYGLNETDEIKTLEVIQELNDTHPMDVVATFMGAHAVPLEFKGNPEGYMELLCNELLPLVKDKNLAEYVDIFCEKGVFDVAQSREYLEAAKGLGFGLKIHTDEIVELGGSALAGEMQVTSAEHLIAIGLTGLASLKEGGVIAMVLPGTSFYLDKNFAPVRRMIDLGIPVAMGTDFNPGSCPSLNLQLIMSLGYLKYKMTPEEILTAVTINAACAIGREEQIGTIEPGKKADLVIWDAPDMEMLCYRFGSNLAIQTIKGGIIV